MLLARIGYQYESGENIKDVFCINACYRSLLVDDYTVLYTHRILEMEKYQKDF